MTLIRRSAVLALIFTLGTGPLRAAPTQDPATAPASTVKPTVQPATAQTQPDAPAPVPAGTLAEPQPLTPPSAPVAPVLAPWFQYAQVAETEDYEAEYGEYLYKGIKTSQVLYKETYNSAGLASREKIRVVSDVVDATATGNTTTTLELATEDHYPETYKVKISGTLHIETTYDEFSQGGRVNSDRTLELSCKSDCEINPILGQGNITLNHKFHWHHDWNDPEAGIQLETFNFLNKAPDGYAIRDEHWEQKIGEPLTREGSKRITFWKNDLSLPFGTPPYLAESDSVYWHADGTKTVYEYDYEESLTEGIRHKKSTTKTKQYDGAGAIHHFKSVIDDRGFNSANQKVFESVITFVHKETDFGMEEFLDKYTYEKNPDGLELYVGYSKRNGVESNAGIVFNTLGNVVNIKESVSGYPAWQWSVGESWTRAATKEEEKIRLLAWIAKCRFSSENILAV